MVIHFFSLNCRFCLILLVLTLPIMSYSFFTGSIRRLCSSSTIHYFDIRTSLNHEIIFRRYVSTYTHDNTNDDDFYSNGSSGLKDVMSTSDSNLMELDSLSWEQWEWDDPKRKRARKGINDMHLDGKKNKKKVTFYGPMTQKAARIGSNKVFKDDCLWLSFELHFNTVIENVLIMTSANK